jgi:hypothetical protein
MSRIFLIPCIFFVLLTTAYAGEIYTYTDEEGNTAITNEPVSKKYENEAKKIESYKRDSSEEIPKQKTNGAKEDVQTQQQKLEQQNNEKAELKCYTEQDTSGVGGAIVLPSGVAVGGTVLPGASWYICKDKNGKIVSKKKL